MKSNLIIFMLLLLVSCTAALSPQHIEEAENICDQNDGLEFISVDLTSYEVYCNNGVNKTFTKERK